jgi:hypothetical protein
MLAQTPNKEPIKPRQLFGLECTHTIKIEAVSKFYGYITQIDGRNQSGLTIHDRVCFIISYHIKIQCFYHNYVSSHLHDNYVQVEQAENMFKRFERDISV